MCDKKKKMESLNLWVMLQRIGYVLYKLNIGSLICSAILVEFTQQSTEIQNASQPIQSI